MNEREVMGFRYIQRICLVTMVFSKMKMKKKKNEWYDALGRV